MSALDFLLQPLQYAFMLRGVLAALMVGVVCATVGAVLLLVILRAVKRGP